MPIWCSLDGVVTADEFERLAQERALKTTQNCSSNRWFNEDDELIVIGSRTYALSNQWGGSNWHKAMNALKDAFPQFQISYTAVVQ